MTLPKNKRGFRKITIDGRNFYWKLDHVIDVRPESKQQNKLTIDFGWFDTWLYMNDKENRPPDFAPRNVTPAFVRLAIQFALKHEWGSA
jgi:hypothetical protein